MATIIFEQVSVNRSLDSNGNKTDVYRYWETNYGLLGRFRASERIGYGDNATWQSFHFRAEGAIAEKMKRMNLKEGSKLFVMGELVPEVFEGKNGPVNRQVVKVMDVRFSSSSSGSQKKQEKKEEKNKEKELTKETIKMPKRIPVPVEKTSAEKHKIPAPVEKANAEKPKIPVPAEKPEAATSSPSVMEEDEILNLDIHELFSGSDGFMGI